MTDIEVAYWFLVWFGFTGLVAFAADARGRNPAVWTILSLIFSPILGGFALLMFPPVTKEC
jgi:hypothetical protein